MATSLLRLNPADRQIKLSRLCLANAESLLVALQYCAGNRIGSLRVGSAILPVTTHPQVGYKVDDLPDAEAICSAFSRCGFFAQLHGIRTVFHPDQFVVLNSPREDVVQQSIEEREFQAEVAEWIGADVINIHAGGAYGDKSAALTTLTRNLDRLSVSVRVRLTVENDDRTYTPADLLPFCRAASVSLVYDAHHHCCLPDGLTPEQVTDAALSTWSRERLFHISSPLEGWNGPRPQRHHDFIAVADFPDCWRQLSVTVEVEAKAKELAVFRLRNELLRRESVLPRPQPLKRANR